MDVSQSTHPIKLTPRQEAFAKAVVAGKAASVAYKEVYKVSAKQAGSNATRLMENDGVKRRIAQLQARNAAATLVTVEFITEKLIDAYELARQTKQVAAAVQAMMGLAKLHGMIIDKQQIDAVIRRPSADPDSPDEMSGEDWEKKYGSPVILPLPSPSSTTN